MSYEWTVADEIEEQLVWFRNTKRMDGQKKFWNGYNEN